MNFQKLILIILFSFLFNSILSAGSFQDLVLVDGFSKGFAITADRSSIDGVIKNPANLISVKKYMMTSSYSSFFNNQYQTYLLGAGITFNQYQLGLSIPVRQISSISETVNVLDRGVQVGNFKDTDMAVKLSVGRMFYDNQMSLASSLGYYTHSIGSDKATGLGLDIGILGSVSGFDLGASIQRLGNVTMKWTTNQNESIPMALNLGLGKKFMDTVHLLSDVSFEKNMSSQLNLGFSWSIKSLCNINIGCRDLLNMKRLSIGLDVSLSTMKIQYAFSQHPQLGAIQKMGVVINSF
tara:strand:- start:49 stop:933 length:885 start_codon:yes stop_codon:yes gene_type:complete